MENNILYIYIYIYNKLCLLKIFTFFKRIIFCIQLLLSLHTTGIKNLDNIYSI